MYKVLVTTIHKKSKKKTVQEFVPGAMDTPEYDAVMAKISDVLFDMDLEFNDIDGDGDMAVDDMLISISEEETFERRMQGVHCDYHIQGSQRS